LMTTLYLYKHSCWGYLLTCAHVYWLYVTGVVCIWQFTDGSVCSIISTDKLTFQYFDQKRNFSL